MSESLPTILPAYLRPFKPIAKNLPRSRIKKLSFLPQLRIMVLERRVFRRARRQTRLATCLPVINCPLPQTPSFGMLRPSTAKVLRKYRDPRCSSGFWPFRHVPTKLRYEMGCEDKGVEKVDLLGGVCYKEQSFQREGQEIIEEEESDSSSSAFHERQVEPTVHFPGSRFPLDDLLPPSSDEATSTLDLEHVDAQELDDNSDKISSPISDTVTTSSRPDTLSNNTRHSVFLRESWGSTMPCYTYLHPAFFL